MGVDSVGYYAAFNRPNVRLVDVSQCPIETVTPRGLVTGGREDEFDTLVLATGFDAVSGAWKQMDLRARHGLSIRDKWRDGPQNYLGLATAGFPNLLNVAGAGSTSAFTRLILSIEHHIDWIADCIVWLDAHGPLRRSRRRRKRSPTGWRSCSLAPTPGTARLGISTRSI